MGDAPANRASRARLPRPGEASLERRGDDLPVEQDVATVERESEERQIIEWRFEQLRLAGFDVETALDLAIAVRVDLHDAEHLVRRGCAPALAARILL
jgi:hypothetical protein